MRDEQKQTPQDVCGKANCTVVFELVNYKRSLVVSFANLTSVASRGFVKRKMEFYFKFLTLIILHNYHNPFGNGQKLFAHPPLYIFWTF